MSVRWPDIDHPRTPSGYQWPPNLMAAQGPASWPRGRRPAGEAEEILSEAVAWWDVERSGFRDGDRWLRNLGSAGGVLDLRLGSSLVANSNDPKWLGVEQTGYVYFPGVVGNSMWTPYESTLNVTDLDAMVDVQLDSYALQFLLSRNDAAFTQSWGLFMLATGVLGLAWFDSGGTYFERYATVALPAVPSRTQIRVTLDVDNGASNYDLKFWTRTSSADSWSQLGATVQGSAATSIRSSANCPFIVAQQRLSNASPAVGRFYRAVLKDAIDGTTLVDIDCDALTSGSATSFTCATGQTCTINRSTSGRKSVAMPARRNGGRACMLHGSDDFLEVQDSQQHGLLNFRSADSYTVLASIRYWATGAANARILSKWASGPGYVPIAIQSGNTLQTYVTDGSGQGYPSFPSFTYGAQTTMTSIRDRSRKTVSISTGANTASATDGTQNLWNTRPFTVGREAGVATTYADMEFRAAAVWRRPLTTREITVLANSGIWGT